MGVLDRIIAGVSPKWHAQREAWRQSVEMVKNYDAGQHDRLNAGWNVFNQSAEPTDRAYRSIVRARARDLERNSDFFEANISPFLRNVIGSGITLQAKTDDSDLNDKIERLWKEWCKPKNCDATGSQSFRELCKMAIRRKKVDGGIFLVKRFTDDGKFKFCLQIIEVDALEENQITPSKKGNNVVSGVEIGKYGRAEGYWFRRCDTEGVYTGESEFVPAKDAIFWLSRKRPSQIREMSEFAAAVTRIRDMNQFMEAVSVKERIAACLSVFVTKENPSGGGYGRGALSGAQGFSYEGKKLTPGMISELAPGEGINVVNPGGQSTNATEFIRTQQRLSASGVGLSYEAVSRDMSNVNYSSARQGLIEDWKTFDDERESLTEHVLNEIYESFIISCVLSGLISAPDFWADKQKYLAHTWIPQAQKWIDPLKEASANKVALSIGAKTYKQLAAETGQDYQDMLDDISEVYSYARGLGIDGLLFGDQKKEATL